MKKITTNNGSQHSFQLTVFGFLVCDIQRHNIHLIIQFCSFTHVEVVPWMECLMD